MNQVVKRVAARFWALGEPIRRPFVCRVHTLVKKSVDQSIAELVHPPLGELLVGVATARREVGCYRNETNLLLDNLVREVVRLQRELDSLRDEYEKNEQNLMVLRATKTEAA
jgi:hypothetical protein